MNPTLTVLEDGPRRLRVGPLEIKLGPMRVRHLAALKRHLSARGGDPLERLLRRLGRFDERQQEILLRRAYEDFIRGDEAGYDDVESYLNTVEGLAHALSLCAEDVGGGPPGDELERHLNDMLATDYFAVADEALSAMGLILGNGRGQAVSESESGGWTGPDSGATSAWPTAGDPRSLES